MNRGPASRAALKGHEAAVAQEPAPHAAPEPWHALNTVQVARALDVDTSMGLGEAEARTRLAQSGPNRPRQETTESIWAAFLDELHEPMILLLLVTGVLYSIWGELADALTIFAVIFILLSVEVFNERRAKLAIAGLSRLAEPTAAVLRGGHHLEISIEQLVPGDVVLLQAGRRVPADLRLTETYGLAIDESALTGESVPLEKDASARLPEAAVLAERLNMAYAGTTVVRGRGTAISVATGPRTELSRIARLAREIEPPRTVLQTAMGELSRYLAIAAIAFAVLVPALGVLLARQPLRQMLLTGLSLAFSVIPEELPIIITMVLGLGAYRLAQRHAIVKRLQAVETLGAITVIATDKTGTLTENRMQASRLYPQECRDQLLRIGVLCNDAVGEGAQRHWDPLDVAMLRAAREAGMNPETLRSHWRVHDEFTFDNLRKRMSILLERDGSPWVLTKGAPEAVLSICEQRWRGEQQQQPLGDAERRSILSQAEGMARAGLRVVAFAAKRAESTALTEAQAESCLGFVGLVGFEDPPRPEVRQAVSECRTAGIRTLMVTGDHPLTASAISRAVGIGMDGRVLTGSQLDSLSEPALRDTVAEVSVYARTNPEHKLRIVSALHAGGERVAVTGDGINDAPALAAADIGIAMGETGTDVAREAAGLVLADDNFATIVSAIREGRVLFANLTKGVRYYLACKVALVSAALLPVLLGVAVPFAPVQIILMELFMDLAASATFVVEPPEAGLMQRPPRDPRAPFMSGAMVSRILSAAAGLSAAVSVAYLLTWYRTHDLARAQTMAFVTWLLGHVLLALNMRSEQAPLMRIGLLSNRLMLWWGLATVSFVLVVTFSPRVGALFKVVPLSGPEWALAIGTALIGTFWLELGKLHLARQPALH